MRVKFLPFLEARDFVRSLGLKNVKEWYKYSKKDKPINIPATPEGIYENCGWTSWMDWLGTNNPGLRERKYKVNDDYFKKWSHNMAYILGFWFADGNISSKCHSGKYQSYAFNIVQHKNDKYLLEGILREMDSNYPISKNANCYALRICSKAIYDDVIRLGGKERKSLDVKFPYVPQKYLPDFIRGLWDGDGCISYSNCAKSYVSCYDSGSSDFIEGLYDVLKKNISNLNGSLYHRSVKKHCLYFSKNDTIRLKKFMYQGQMDGKLTLRRKYDLFLKTPDYCSDDFLDYNNAQRFIRLLDIKTSREWRQYCDSGKIPRDIPKTPNQVYKNSGWIDWYDWLGTSKDREE
jgi:hypothetical protein